jgi:hypothetical protein
MLDTVSPQLKESTWEDQNTVDFPLSLGSQPSVFPQACFFLTQQVTVPSGLLLLQGCASSSVSSRKQSAYSAQNSSPLFNSDVNSFEIGFTNRRDYPL